MMCRLWTSSLRPALPKVALTVVVIVLGGALALLPLRLAAALLLASGMLLVALVHPASVLVLLAFAVPFGSLLQLSLGPTSISAADALVLLLLLSWIAGMVAGRRVVVPRLPILLPLLAFLTAAFISTFSAASMELAVKELVKWGEILVVFAFVGHAVGERWGRWLVLGMLAAGSAEAAFGVSQFLRRAGPEGFVLFGRFLRAFGHFGQPNPFAGYLGLVVPVAYALVLEGLAQFASVEARARSGAGNSLRRLVCFAAPFAAMSVAVGMSWSRGGWIGLAAALTVVTLLRGRAARFGALTVLLCAGMLLLVAGARYVPAALTERLTGLTTYLGSVDVTSVQVTDANWALVERIAHWQAAVDMLTDYPISGVGIGNYAVAYPQYAVGRWQDPLGHAHNFYLNIAAECGLFGLTSLLFLIGACFAYAWRVLQQLSSAAQRADAANARSITFWRGVALGATGVLVHWSVHSLFDNLLVHHMNVQLALTLGLLVVAEKRVDACWD